jgi:hypothetical protein
MTDDKVSLLAASEIVVGNRPRARRRPRMER